MTARKISELISPTKKAKPEKILWLVFSMHLKMQKACTAGPTINTIPAAEVNKELTLLGSNISPIINKMIPRSKKIKGSTQKLHARLVVPVKQPSNEVFKAINVGLLDFSGSNAEVVSFVYSVPRDLRISTAIKRASSEK